MSKRKKKAIKIGTVQTSYFSDGEKILKEIEIIVAMNPRHISKFPYF